MARIQQGANAITVWMIVFVALWLTSTVFLVILYTGQEDLNSEIANLRRENDRLATQQQMRSLELVKAARPAADGGPTVVGILEDARAETARMATGAAGDAPATVRSKRDELLRIVRSEALVSNPNAFTDVSLHEGMSRLYETFKTEATLRREADQRLSDLESQVGKLVSDNTAMKNDFERRTQELTSQLEQAESDREAFRNAKDGAIAAMEREYEQRRAQETEILTGERTQRAGCEEKLGEAQKRYLAMRERLGGMVIGPEELATARKPDGRILTAIPGDPVVYVDLGRKNALVLGLQFAVYSAETGIPPDGRGKAAIEVVSINESSAECRILGVARNEVILQGDLIANPVYDPNEPPSFVVIGEFDLDGDGSADRGGTEAVAALITRWGGEVADSPTPLTSFIVVGASPRRPRPGSDVPPDQVEINNARQRDWDRYHNALSTAQGLSIPVLTQDVFLNFLGYGQRYARR